MAAKLSEGDTITMTGEVTKMNDDGTVMVRLHGYVVPVIVTQPRLLRSRYRTPSAIPPPTRMCGRADFSESAWHKRG